MSDQLVYAEPMVAGVPVYAGMFEAKPPQWSFRSELGQPVDWMMGVFALDLIRTLFPNHIFDGLKLPDGRFLALDVVSTNQFWEQLPSPPLHARKKALWEMVTRMMAYWTQFSHWTAPPIFTVEGFLAYHPVETSRASQVWEETGYPGVLLVDPEAPYRYPEWWRPVKEKT